MNNTIKDIRIVIDDRTVCQKVESLKKLGVIVTVKGKDEKIENGYVLGKMKDSRPNLEVMLAVD